MYFFDLNHSSLLLGYVTNKMAEKALDLFETIPFKLDEVLCIIVYNACASLSNERAIRLGKKLFVERSNEQSKNTIVNNSAIDMLMKFGDVAEAERLFQSLKNKSIITYGAMMKGN